MIFITRKEHFSVAHKLENSKFSESENLKMFGKCYDLHGHNYYLEVTLIGTPDPNTGYVMDLKELKNIIHSEVISKFDHKYLNELYEFQGIITTAENIVIKIWELLKDKLATNNAKLYSIKLYETEKNIVEYKG